MYFWNIRALKDQLSQGPLPQKDAFQYILAMELLYTFAASPMFFVGGEANIWDFVDGVTMVLLTLIGVRWFYQYNGGALGKHFLSRYVSLSWVFFIRYFTVALPLVLLFYGGIGSLFGYSWDDMITTPMDIIVNTVIFLLYYVFLLPHVEEVRKRSNSSKETVACE